MIRFLTSLCLAVALLAGTTRAALSEDKKAEIERLANGLQYRDGRITLEDGIATVNVGSQFKYFDAKDAQSVLTQMWENPPDSSVLGLLIPTGMTPLDPAAWAVIISFDPGGYVKDDDAAKIDYSKLLQQMQEAQRAENAQREKEGYPALELIDWATPPRYDRAEHKLYWAKRLRVAGAPEDTLNYCIRALGRRGVLQLNAVASMDQLPQVEQATPAILSMVNFDEGNRYTDFNSKTDKVAEYGIAALIAGGILAKTGILKGLLVAIIALKKFVIIGVLAVVAFFKRLYARVTTPKDNRLDA